MPAGWVAVILMVMVDYDGIELTYRLHVNMGSALRADAKGHRSHELYRPTACEGRQGDAGGSQRGKSFLYTSMAWGRLTTL
jgi:hypothetical protein